MSSRLSSVSNLLKGQKMFQVKEAAAKLERNGKRDRNGRYAKNIR